MCTLETAFRSLFEVNMGIRPGERIVVFSDTIRPDESVSRADQHRRLRLLDVAVDLGRFAEKTFGNTSFLSYPATAASGAEPPLQLWELAFGPRILGKLTEHSLFDRLARKEGSAADLAEARRIVREMNDAVADVVIALANNSTSHTTFRALVNEAGGRYASLPHFEPDMFHTSMQVDWHALAERTSRLASAVNEAVEIEITTPNGTGMRLSKNGRTAAGDDGLLHAPGSFGNLPAGEVYLAPVEGTSEGTLVLEYSPSGKLSSPLTLIVRQGNVVSITGDDPYGAILEAKFAENPKNRNIAELGIGTNDKASRPDNVLEAEKILGTIHIALGDNSGFGGTVKTPFHEDFVFYNPTVTVFLPGGGSRKIIERGVLSLSSFTG